MRRAFSAIAASFALLAAGGASEPTVLLQPFASAPYPHASRASGYTYGTTFYDAPAHYSDATVGIVVPAGYQPRATADFVVHFHGWSNHVAQVLEHYRLPQQLQESGRNAILIVPQGPKDAQDSGDGKLELDDGALKRLLDDVLTFLRARKITGATAIGRVVITAHSGGYKAASAVLVHGGVSDRVTDVVLFDATYGELEGFANWFRGGANRRLVSFFTDALGTADVALMALAQDARPLAVRLDPDWSPDDLRARRAAFVLCRTIPHDELLQQRNFFAVALTTSALDPR